MEPAAQDAPAARGVPPPARRDVVPPAGALAEISFKGQVCF